MKTITIPVMNKGNWEIECARLTKREREIIATAIEILRIEIIQKKHKEIEENERKNREETLKETENIMFKLRKAIMLDEI